MLVTLLLITFIFTITRKGTFFNLLPLFTRKKENKNGNKMWQVFNGRINLSSLQEVSISKRFALKESQNKLIQNLIKDARLNEEQADAIMKNHLANMAAIDKATDEERTRRVMALEMRLAERRALARQKVS